MADHVMTKELREQMLGLLPFSTDAKLEYTPAPYTMKRTQADGTETDAVPEEYRPSFTLRRMTRKELDTMKTLTKNKKVEDDTLCDIVANIVLGWENLWDLGTNQIIPYKADPNGGCDRELFRSSVPSPIIADLAMCMIRMNGILGTEHLSLKS